MASSDHRYRVGILGATGSVGQKLVRLLEGHPWFELTVVTASERSMGRRYAEAVHWLEPTPLPADVADLVVRATEPEGAAGRCDLVFSALDSGVARQVEPAFAGAGVPVVSNASALRMDPRVPLLVPEVNPDHLGLVSRQEYGEGFVVTNPNCATVGLVMALKPLADRFGIDTVQVTTLQAISGAGYPGVASLDILGNVIPDITNEEEKLHEEPGKILGRLTEDGGVEPDPLRISAQVTRVPVIDGHTLSISVKLRRPAGLTEVEEAFTDFRSPIAAAGLPSAPQQPLQLMGEGPYPQPRLHAELGGGMVVSIGRLRPCPVADYRLVALVHNTIRGAAGAAILNAELLVHRGLIS